jgi:hypothetical protein
MQGNLVTYSFWTAGTLAADHVIKFKAPEDLELIHVSAVVSNAANTAIKIGSSTSDAAYLALANVGYSGTPAEFTKANFVGTEYPHIVAGTIITITLDYDGSSGTPGANACTILSFFEG